MLPSGTCSETPLEHEDHVVVDDLDAVDVQNDVFESIVLPSALPIGRVECSGNPDWRLPEGSRRVISR